jgi:hypothetical protein
VGNLLSIVIEPASTANQRRRFRTEVPFCPEVMSVRSLATPEKGTGRQLSGHDILVMAVLLSLAVIGLDQFLRVSPAQFVMQPGTEIQHWIADSLMATPLFAVGIAAGDWIAGRARLTTDRRTDLLKRAMLITGATALVLSPAWFQVDRTDNPITSQPLVFPQAHDSGDVYWVTAPVIVALACTCLVPAAAWAGHWLSRGLPASRASRVLRVTTMVLLISAVPVLAWLLHQAAVHAYSSRVYYTSAAATGQRPAAAPFALGYQAAHALQDGLAGQAAGLPVTVAVLLVGVGRRPAGTRRPARIGRENVPPAEPATPEGS